MLFADVIKLVDAKALSEKLCSFSIKVDLKYATTDNFIGRPIAGYTPGLTDIALLTIKPALHLCKVQNELNKKYNYGLLVYDAYRPARAVQDFLQWSKQSIVDEAESQRKKNYYPNISRRELFTLGYLAEDSSHCYCNTVDLVLLDLNSGNKLDMGTDFDYMDKKAWPTASATEIGETAYRNRQILLTTMSDYGFEYYEREFWHFSYQGKQGREITKPLDVVITSDLLQQNLDKFSTEILRCFNG